MGYKSRKRWAIFALLVGLPAYVVAAVTAVNWLERPPFWAEFLVYVGLGLIWILPLKPLFKGIGQPDPDKPSDE